MSFHANVIACAKCVPYECAGVCPCPVDQIDIRRHAREGYCPHAEPRFGDGAKPSVWNHLNAPPLPIPNDYKPTGGNATAGRCCS
jgi:hypothetical protein